MNTIFIVGSSSGIGKATAKLFAEKGWTVIATMRTPGKETELTAYDNVHLYPLDVTNPEQIAQTVCRTWIRWKRQRKLRRMCMRLFEKSWDNEL